MHSDRKTIKWVGSTPDGSNYFTIFNDYINIILNTLLRMGNICSDVTENPEFDFQTVKKINKY